MGDFCLGGHKGLFVLGVGGCLHGVFFVGF